MMVEALERVRMCVAEAGYNPAEIKAPRYHPWALFEANPERIPTDVAWRAREVAGLGKPMCLSCCRRQVSIREPQQDQCRAHRRLEMDCGRVS